MATAAENLTTLQATYTDTLSKLAEVMANPKPNYTIDGVSVDRNAYRQQLLDMLKSLREIPGVAPPDIIDEVVVGRG